MPKVKSKEINDKTNDNSQSGFATGAEHLGQPVAPGTDVDNASNRKIGRVAFPKRSMVVSKAKNSNQRYITNPCTGSEIPAESLNGKNYEVANQIGTVDSFSDDTTPIGHRKGEAVVCKDSNISHVPATDVKRYVDNPKNRRIGRVGEPVGTVVYSSKNKCVMQKNYGNSSFNIKQGRAGKPLGSLPIQKKKSKTTAKIPEMLKRIEDKDEVRTTIYRHFCSHNESVVLLEAVI
jgi:hypothetical protein